VTHVLCEIVLAKGRWEHPLTPARLRSMLKWRFKKGLLDVTFHAPAEENAVEMEISVAGDEDACDWARDAVFETLLRFKPEYESMIDVSLAVD
jgi:hypothetical protein